MQVDGHFNRKIIDVHFKDWNELYPSTIVLAENKNENENENRSTSLNLYHSLNSVSSYFIILQETFSSSEG